MPVYHSDFNEVAEAGRVLCGCALLPLRTSESGPVHPTEAERDIVDEAIDFFRANVMFRAYELKGAADRTLVYLTLFVNQCLSEIESIDDPREATRALYSLACKEFVVPGDASFPVAAMYPVGSTSDKAALREYMKQLRTAVGPRLVEKVYSSPLVTPHWKSFAKRKFMNKKL